MSTPLSPTVLFCPLNWGLGHITRDLPLIKEFIKHHYRVVVATDAPLDQWLKKELPEAETIFFAGPRIRYSRSRPLLPILLLQLPGMIRWIKREKKRVAQLIQLYQPSLIVSDNRYGARSKKVTSIIITHQLMIKMPRGLKRLEGPTHRLIKWMVTRFDECWVPDYSKPYSLAGDLVHKYPLPPNALLIGPLSRFDEESLHSENTLPHDSTGVLSLISGPEPQRSVLEDKIIKNLVLHRTPGTIVAGRPGGSPKATSNGNIRIVAHLPTLQMLQIIKSHAVIVCRPGYSTIMDLHFLKKSAWLIATPGQTEQLYLARYHDKKGHHSISQNKLEQQFFTPVKPHTSYSMGWAQGSEDFRQILRHFFEGHF